MKITFCDVCHYPPRGLPMTTFESAGRIFDVCSACDTMPFRVPRATRVMVTLVPARFPSVEVFTAHAEPGDTRPGQPTPQEASK